MALFLSGRKLLPQYKSTQNNGFLYYSAHCIGTCSRKEYSVCPISYMCPAILIVDDHETVRKGIRGLISTDISLTICGEAADGLEAIAKVRELHPEIVLMDITMPTMNGVEATRVIRKEFPDCAVILVSQNDPEIVCRQTKQL